MSSFLVSRTFVLRELRHPTFCKRGSTSRIDVFISEPMLTEVVRTLDEPHFLARVSLDLLLSALSDLRMAAASLRITELVSGVATHPEDDLVLATAASVRADYLVTGDRQLLRLDSCEGVSIISPADFVRVLDEHDAGESNPNPR